METEIRVISILENIKDILRIIEDLENDIKSEEGLGGISIYVEQH